MRKRLVAALAEMTPHEGPNTTFLKNVTLVRISEHRARVPLLYDQSMCLAAQGHKVCHLPHAELTYGEKDLLVIPTVVPVEIDLCPEDGVPLLSLTLSIDLTTIQELLTQMKGVAGFDEQQLSPPGLYLEPLTEEIVDATARLLDVLRTQEQAEVLGPGIIRELHYYLLRGAQGHQLAAAACGDTSYARISRVLRRIHDDYAKPLDVAELAGLANMSQRAFYSHFKAVTSLAPVQYVKKIRLEKARKSIAVLGAGVGAAARSVGYESPSQFSREFKRHFGYAPRDAVLYSAVLDGAKS